MKRDDEINASALIGFYIDEDEAEEKVPEGWNK